MMPLDGASSPSDSAGASIFPNARSASERTSRAPSGLAPSRRELRCVIAVVRHGDRTPKRKLKVKTTHPSIVQIHRDRCKTPKKEVKLKESKDLRAFSSTLKAILLKDDIDAFR